MNDQRQWRTWILAGTCCGVAAIALLSLVHPLAGNRSVAAYHFPEAMPLAGWQLARAEPLPERRKNFHDAADSVQSGRRYSYVSNGVPLDAEIRYLLGTLGNIRQNLELQLAIPRQAFDAGEVRHHDGSGAYGLFAHEGRAYLSTCINPRGGTTATVDQFLQNHRDHDFTPSRVRLWLLGRESLRDYRCLWVNLSTPVNGGGLPAAYRRLESAWTDWGRGWPLRFPGYSAHNPP